MEQEISGEAEEAFHPSAAYCRIAAAARHRIVEAPDQFSEIARRASLTHIGIKGTEDLPDNTYRVHGRYNYFFTGTKVYIPGFELRVTGNRNAIYIGPWVRYKGLRVTITGDDNVVFVGWHSSGGDVHIVISGNNRLSMIGEECMLSSPITIGTENEVTIYNSYNLPVSDKFFGPEFDIRNETIIDDKVWIGRDISVSSGVYVGSNAVIGQCAVVTENVPPGAIVAGAPASIIRRGVVFSRAIETDSLDGSDETMRRVAIKAKLKKLILYNHDQDVSIIDNLTQEPLPSTVPDQAKMVTLTDHETSKILLMKIKDVAHLGPKTLKQEDFLSLPISILPSLTTIGDVSYKNCGPAGKNNFLIASRGAIASDIKLRVGGSNNIIYISPDAKLSGTTIKIRGSNNFIFIGARTTVSDRVQILISENSSRFYIGNDCEVGVGTILSNSDGALIYDDKENLLIRDAEILIGNGVLIGAYCRIHNGVTIGDDAMLAVGTNAIGTLSAHTLYAGVPAAAIQSDLRWRRSGVMS